MTDPTRPVPRRRARPAPDEGVDPIDTPQAPAMPPAPLESPQSEAPALAALPVRRKAEPTVQLGTRIAVSVDAMLTAAAQKTGATKRDLIEHAIRSLYGSN